MRYEYRLVDDEQSVSHGTFAIIDNQIGRVIGRVIGHLHSRVVADTIVRELNKLEPAPEPSYFCECHERMGNDFYFLPADKCLKGDRKCAIA